MDPFKMVNICKWRYCKISHIVGVKKALAKLKSLSTIPLMCCDNAINHEINEFF